MSADVDLAVVIGDYLESADEHGANRGAFDATCSACVNLRRRVSPIAVGLAEHLPASPWLREALAGAWDAGTTDGQVSMLHVLLPPIEGDEKRGVDRLLSVMKADQWLEQNERNPYRENQTGANHG